MLRPLTVVAAAGLAGSALALAVPATGHAATRFPGAPNPPYGTAGGTCSTGAQHTGPGHHSFTDSHNNCVQFSDSSQTAFLNDSDFNSILFDANTPNNTIREFNNSNNNRVEFLPGAAGNTLQSTNSNSNTVYFCGTAPGPSGANCGSLPAALNDFVTLDNVQQDYVVIYGSNGFVNVLPGTTTTDACLINAALYTSAAGYSTSNPAPVVC